MIWLLALACTGGSESDTAESRPTYAVYPASRGISAPWDAWIVQSDPGSAPKHPYVLSQEGLRTDLVPVIDHAGVPYAWRPEPPLAPGAYEAGFDEVDTTAGYWVVDSTGRDEAFRLSDVAGRVYVLSDGAILLPALGVGSLMEGYVFQQAYLQVDRSVRTEPREDGAIPVPFRIVVRPQDGAYCQLLQGQGQVSPTGEFWWSKPLIEGDAEPDPVHVEDVSLHFGWNVPEDRIGGAEMTATIDVRALDDRLGSNTRQICEIAAEIGTPCFDCIGDGRASCLELALHGGTLLPVTNPDDWQGGEVPACPMDLDAAAEALDCSGSGSGCGAMALVLVVPAWRRRKR